MADGPVGGSEGRKNVPKLKELLRRQRRDSDVSRILSFEDFDVL